MTVELPFSARIVEASPERPYLGVRLDLDPAVVGSVMVEAGIPAPRTPGDAKAFSVSTLDAKLPDATLRLVRLLDATSAGIRVGYNDASHFSRDYKKHIGTAPARDVEWLRATIGGMVP